MDEEETGDTFDMNIKISDPVKIGKLKIYFKILIGLFIAEWRLFPVDAYEIFELSFA